MKRKITTIIAALSAAACLSACEKEMQTVIDELTSTEEADAADVAQSPQEAQGTPEGTADAPTQSADEAASEETERIRAALGGMPYYGDIANCKMTAEQATAFAQLIADGLAGDFGFRKGYDDFLYDITSWSEPFQVLDYAGERIEVNRYNVMLADCAGDGVPYIYISSSTNPSPDEVSFEVYKWNGNGAVFFCEDSIFGREKFNLVEQEDGTVRLLQESSNEEIQCGNELLWMAVGWTRYAFVGGDLEPVSDRALAKSSPMDESGVFRIIENGKQTGECTDGEYDKFYEKESLIKQKESHTHTMPYTCFYDMKPCTLEEMVGYLNAYAAAVSGGQAVPVKIRKANVVKHEGTGITTKGDVPKWKVDMLEELRKCMLNGLGEQYPNGLPEFYFGLLDINRDEIQELIITDQGYSQLTNVYIPSYSGSLYSVVGADSEISGFDPSTGTWLIAEGWGMTVKYYLCTCNGTGASVISTLYAEWNDSPDIPDIFQLTADGATRDLSGEEFRSIESDWANRHTNIIQYADTHLDIENIERKLKVKITQRESGEWLVTNAIY